jgi:hypothetical protein
MEWTTFSKRSNSRWSSHHHNQWPLEPTLTSDSSDALSGAARLTLIAAKFSYPDGQLFLKALNLWKVSKGGDEQTGFLCSLDVFC